VRAVYYFLVATLGLALLASGTLPPEHLHHSTDTRLQVVHSHFERVRSSGPHRVTLSDDDDDHAAAIDLDRVMAGGPTVTSAHQPALVTDPVTVSAPSATLAIVDSREPSETPSPPRPPSPSRAPPASH